MRDIIISFIGIAINIWKDTQGTGGSIGPGPFALQQRDNSYILDRAGNNILTRV